MTKYGVVDPEKFDAAQARDAKPLHVLVAEALGWTAYLSKHGHFVVTHGDGEKCEEAFGRHDPSIRYDGVSGKRLPERTRWWADCSHIPPFGEDSPEGWACTGPLLERFMLGLTKPWNRYPEGNPVRENPWNCYRYFPTGPGYIEGNGLAAPEAIARCVVALAAAGKLLK